MAYPIFILLLLQNLLSAHALASGRCEPVFNPANPRQMDISFPDKQVSILGHIHPIRDADIREKNLEEKLQFALKFPRTLRDPAAKGHLQALVEENAAAIDQWREDLEFVKKYLESKSFANIGVEYRDDELTMQKRNAATEYANIEQLLEGNYFAGRTKEELLTIALTAPLYLKLKAPHLMQDVNLTSFEPSNDETNRINAEVCAEVPTDTRSEELADFYALYIKGYPNNLGLAGEKITAAIHAATELLIKFPAAKLRELRVDTLLNEFRKNLGAPLTEEMKRPLKIYMSPQQIAALEKSFKREFTDGESRALNAFLAKQIDRRVSASGCSARDIGIARKLAQSKGSSLLLIGEDHLANLAKYLKQECMRQVEELSPAAMGEIVPPETAH